MARRRKSVSLLERLSLDEETGSSIFSVLLFAAAGFLLLSALDLAGSLGRSLDRGLEQAVGVTRLLVPFFLAGVAVHRTKPEWLPLRAANTIGFILVFFSLNPLLTALASGDQGVSPDLLLKSGGRVGALIAEPFLAAIGKPGSVVLFVGLALIAFLLLFNATLRQVAEVLESALRALLRALGVMLAPIRWLWAAGERRREERIRSAVVPTPSPTEEAAEDVAEDEETEEEEDDAAEEEEEEDEGQEDSDEETEEAEEVPQVPPKKPKKKQPRIDVPMELLTRRDQKPTSGDIVHNQRVIQRTLETFGIPVEMGEHAVGPTVTQFTLKPAEGIKLTRITGLHNDLALALAAHPIRIEAPIPGKSLVGIEVPNQSVAAVGLRELLETKDWKDRKSAISFALGRDVTGKPWFADIGRMPHLLVAGSTGSGKSVCLNVLITSLLFANGPDELKMILVDPKRVELQVYNGVPHLLAPVITEVPKTVSSLKWGLKEMDRRFDLLSKFGARDIATYNARADEKLPYLVFVIDELADLMVNAMQEVEGPIVRLAQMARAVGIHLILATQRPSVDVLTGLIKANIPARIAFAVASAMDSRTILDQTGAEKLIGRGDMLFQTAEMASPRRIQGAFVSDDEIRRVVEHIKSRYEPVEYDASVTAKPGSGEGGVTGMPVEDDADPMLPEAREEILRAGKGSASLLQRRLKVGYARAARLIDLLEQEGFIGPGEGAKPREILKTHISKGTAQIPAAPAHPALAQVNREMPALDEEDGEDEQDGGADDEEEGA
jgi:S-DNA-T family DNA segregation ATPase FtsK/SpoIIIE